MFKKLTLYRGLSCVFTVLLIVMILAGNMLERNSVMVDQALGTKSYVTITKNEGDLFTSFTPDEDFLTEDGKLSPAGYTKAHTDLIMQNAREGFVLLKNTGNTLPLKENGKITVFGRRSYSTVTNSLTAAGFTINNLVAAAYGSGAINGVAALPSLMNPPVARNKTYQKYNAHEGPGDWVTKRVAGGESAALASFVDFPDAAIVTLGRNGAEGPDYEASSNGVPADSGARNPMGLFDSERSIVKLACDNFSKVIVIINAVNMMELGELKDNPKVGAILWIGTPAGGSNAIGEIIKGTVNPSGGLYSTYARNALSAPALKNMGSFYFKNWMDFGEGIPNPGTQGTAWGKFMRGPNYPGEANGGGVGQYGELPFVNVADKKGGRVDTGNPNTNGTDAGLETYLMEAENIYVGYRYYETRYFDCVNGDAGAKSATGKYDSTSGWNYDQEMAYGFGFGLSYTTFDFTMGTPTFEKSLHEVIAKVPVTVKNTGSVAGKTSVQIYGQSPYTAYDKTNLVEKSSIQLLNFQKTKLLAPNETENFIIDVDLQDIASYDYKTAKTYIMDVNDNYYFAVGNGAHDALNNILALQGKTKAANGMTYDGKAAAAKKWSYTHPTSSSAVVDTFTFSYAKTGVRITNQTPSSHYDYYEPGVVKELSRQDWSGTYPKTYANLTLTANQKLMDHYNGEYIDIKTTDSADAVTWEANNGLTLGHMKGARFDDNRWPDLLDQLSIKEAIQGVIRGGRGFANMPTVGFPMGSYSENGPGTPVLLDSNKPAEDQAPWKISSNTGVSGGTMPAASVLASTFNPDISKEWGRVAGNDSIFAEKPILWMPGANTHRHAFNGRMFLYYSEDPVLTGVHVMETAVAALEKGAIISAKHLAFNDQEQHRFGVGAFMTEQRAREIELRAFQIPFESNKYDTAEKDVGMLGVMMGFNKLGGVEMTVHEGVLTNIMRNEWGFNGYCVSDLKDDLDLMRQGSMAGMTGWDWRLDTDDIIPYQGVELWTGDKDLMIAMKESIKRDLYTFANSNFMNSVNTTSYAVWNMTWWRQIYIAGIVICSVIVLASAAMYLVSLMLQRQNGGI